MKKIINSIKTGFVALIMVAGLASISFVSVAQAAPVDVFENSCSQAGNAGSDLCDTTGQKPLFGANSIFTDIVNVIIYIVGAVAVVMIIIGGLRYVLSAGNAPSVNGAKNTILYAVVGLVIAILSYAIVNFVITKI